MSRLPFQQCF
ncbi:hypothetical protein LINPERPRIM_LOCUS15927 [Linum perenne]